MDLFTLESFLNIKHYKLHLYVLLKVSKVDIIKGTEAASQVKATVFPLISGEKSVGGSPIGGPAKILIMLDFCSRHAIEPTIEQFPFSRVNEAMSHLESGKARYRIVLKNDFK